MSTFSMFPASINRRSFLYGLGAATFPMISSKSAGADPVETLLQPAKIYARGAKVPPGLQLRVHQQHLAASAMEIQFDSGRLKDIIDQSYTPTQVSVDALPRKFDWRDRQMVTPVRDQGFCGSCFIFGSLAAFESAYLIANKHYTPALNPMSIEVSEQQLLDCGISEADCVSGGWHDFVFTYLHLNGGVNSDLYRYNQYASQRGVYCVSNWRSRPFLVRSWNYISQTEKIPKLEDLKSAIINIGPVVSGVNAISDETAPAGMPLASWDRYKGGVINSVPSNSKDEDVNHDVAIIGWDDGLRGRDADAGAWIVKNSWGTDWGGKGKDAGYIFVPYTSNNIGFGASWVKAWSIRSLSAFEAMSEMK